MKTKYIKTVGIIIFSFFIFGTVQSIAQTLKQQTPKEKSSTSQGSITACITIEEMLQQIDARDKRLEATKIANNNKTHAFSDHAKNNQSNPDADFEFSGDYNDLLTLELAARITGFDPSKSRKTHTLIGMASEILRYNWENGREEVKEKSATNRKRKVTLKTDIVQIKYVDFEADMESFIDFLRLDDYPELSKINGIGESAYWDSKQNHLEVYAKGISFTVEVDISDDDNLDKEKTIELAKLIVEERIK